ncbi:hypothetical protein D3C76_147430 [compost metagenome]|jgi:hypothetical protein|uniref:Uncharacterized protein n=1 Tax=Paenibacillus odorifer TaxID=189426 RepID=A0A1R0Z7T5_9BACL|nr:hypothetical protein [Paenibacillus odorifer]OMD44964.1 hypothetical protein BSK51_29940 [Paenibacillus odorifer]OME64258.1 hypothetical protein BSK65_29250 [Paenibacillus odorifer]
MSTALTTFVFKGEREKYLDLEVSLSISTGQCIELLKQANWLPDNWEFKCEASRTGEEWIELGPHAVLAEIIQGDGAIVRILPY